MKAQIVRRVEDRWIGFGFSQKLWQIFSNYEISAGRVQTPVLGWVISQEQASKVKKKVCFVPELDLFLEGVEEKLLELDIQLLEEKTKLISPPPPYTTDELLKDANNILKLSVQEVMKLSQDLFELGLITYHRTDSTSVSQQGLNIAEEFLGEDFKPRSWRQKEGAHECIRPTRSWDRFMWQRMIYEGVASVEITPRHLSLYDLIFRRFMASQCKESVACISKYKITSKDKSFIEERITKIEGKAYTLYRNVKVKTPLPLGKKKFSAQIKLIPQAYPFTQADIISLMREKSLGRPSTYSSIIQKLFARKYIVERKRLIFSTPLGRKVYFYLAENYQSFFSEERTKRLLEKMDKIERGEFNYLETLRDIYDEIKKVIDK